MSKSASFHPASSARGTRPPKPSLRQRGITLIELLVGVLIGLMVVAIASAALMASRGISGTVSDASEIQQQAAYAMRTIGQQLRQTGSLFLNLNPANQAEDAMTAVGLEIRGSTQDIIAGDDTSVDIRFARYAEPVFTSVTPISASRNCVGGPIEPSTAERIESRFELNGGNLRCAGNGGGAQPIIGNVADFQVRYLVQGSTAPGNSTIAYAKAADVADWNTVQGVEVCMVLFGQEAIDIPADSTYIGCDGNDHAYANQRMHLLFRNVFQLRSQGLM